MIKKDIDYLVLSDIHLGHRKNSAAEIITNLKYVIGEHVKTNRLDLIFLAGDVFDSLLTLSTDDVTDIILWVDWLFNLCAKHDIKLRVLEGTPSHDWWQSKLFVNVDKITKLNLDFKYVKSLSIETIDDLGLSVLYVPDEWSPDTDDTYKQVLELLASNNLRQVDIAIMHGQFGYQLPAHIQKVPRHNEDNYMAIVRYYISIGHVHIYSVFKRIIAQGSFDRLSHNEEHDKGCVHLSIRVNGDMSYFFIPNFNAKTFKTISLHTIDLDASMKRIEKIVSKLRDGSYLRVRAKSDHPVMIGLDDIRKRYPNINFTKQVIDDVAETNDVAESFIDDNGYTPITITRSNIEEQLFGLLSRRGLACPQTTDSLKQTLNAVIN